MPKLAEEPVARVRVKREAPRASSWTMPSGAAVTALRKAQEGVKAKIQRPSEVEVPAGHEVVTHSEIDAFRQCPLKHQLGYVQRWRKDQKEGSALHRGTEWHNLMEVYYGVLAQYPAQGRAKHEQAIWEQIRVRTWPLLVDQDGQQSEQQELLQWMLDGYWQAYGVEEDWEILAVEDAGRLQLVDHKSAADFSRTNEIDIDDQFGLYTWALREMGIDVFGSVRSDARTKRLVGDANGTKLMPLDTRFKRQVSFRTPVELRNIEQDLVDAAAAAWSGFRYSSPNPRQCTWRCDFFEAHLLMRKGVEPDAVLRSYGFEQKQGKHEYYNTEDGK